MASAAKANLQAAVALPSKYPALMTDQPPKQRITPSISLVAGAVGGAMEATVTVRLSLSPCSAYHAFLTT